MTAPIQADSARLRTNQNEPERTKFLYQLADYNGYVLHILEARVGIEPTHKGFADPE
jgi:hypothetical protein